MIAFDLEKDSGPIVSLLAAGAQGRTQRVNEVFATALVAREQPMIEAQSASAVGVYSKYTLVSFARPNRQDWTSVATFAVDYAPKPSTASSERDYPAPLYFAKDGLKRFLRYRHGDPATEVSSLTSVAATPAELIAFVRPRDVEIWSLTDGGGKDRAGTIHGRTVFVAAESDGVYEARYFLQSDPVKDSRLLWIFKILPPALIGFCGLYLVDPKKVERQRLRTYGLWVLGLQVAVLIAVVAFFAARGGVDSIESVVAEWPPLLATVLATVFYELVQRKRGEQRKDAVAG
jgi:hypothetical protein